MTSLLPAWQAQSQCRRHLLIPAVVFMWGAATRQCCNLLCTGQEHLFGGQQHAMFHWLGQRCDQHCVTVGTHMLVPLPVYVVCRSPKPLLSAHKSQPPTATPSPPYRTACKPATMRETSAPVSPSYPLLSPTAQGPPACLLRQTPSLVSSRGL